MWALDFQADQTACGRPLRLVNIVDEYTRQALVMHAGRSMNADQTVAELEALVAARGRAPRFLRVDNGPELTSHAVRDWCRFSGARTVFIEPGAPWQNAFVESFHARVRNELLNVEQFGCLPSPGSSSTTENPRGLWASQSEAPRPECREGPDAPSAARPSMDASLRATSQPAARTPSATRAGEASTSRTSAP